MTAAAGAVPAAVPERTAPSRTHLGALAALSAATLAFEVLLLRLFEYSHWHHFAGLAIALALLGLGAAGTVLALLGPRPAVLSDRWFLGSTLLAAAGLALVLLIQERVALRPVLAGWDRAELARVLLVDLVAFVPFLGAGLAIGHAFLRWPEHPRRVYAANLLGSGAGSAAASLALVHLQVQAAIALCAAGLALTALALAASRREPRYAAVAALALAGGLALVAEPPAPAVSDFKPLSRALELPGARVLAAEPGLRGPMTVVRAESLRIAPGLSLSWPRVAPVSDVAIVGSDRTIVMPRVWPGPGEHLAGSLGGVVSMLRPGARVLALGAGTWGPTGRHGAAHLTWVEADRRILDLARARGAGPPRVEGIADDGLRHLRTAGRDYDVVAVDRVYDGGDAASEDYLLTVEGLGLALSRLGPQGLLALPLELELPPRRYARVLVTLREALAGVGAAEPGTHVAALRRPRCATWARPCSRRHRCRQTWPASPRARRPWTGPTSGARCAGARCRS